MDAFVYGTLCDPAQCEAVLGHAAYGPDATLVGLHRVEGRYPTLAPGGDADGRVLRLREDDLDALDAYEGVDRGLYVRVRVPGGEGDMWTYVGDPGALGANVDWPGEGSFRERVERYLEAHDVHVER